MDLRALEARARAEGTPVLDGERATFLWRGRGQAFIMGDFQDWQGEPLPLGRVGPGRWARTLVLPRDAYVEYALTDARGRRLKDPYNRRLVDNGVGGENHFFYMPEGRPTPTLKYPRGNGLKGRVTRHRVETAELAWGRTREVLLYAPPVSKPCPLLVVLDGTDYQRLARLAELVDALIEARRMRPVALAMVANGGKARTVEYACSEATRGFLQEKVLGLAREELRLVDERRHPGVHGVMGASLGGLMALYMGLRSPEVFGHVLSQSGGFSIPGFGDLVVYELARVARRERLKVWMDCGSFEQLLEGNRRMAPLLAEAGHAVRYREYAGGHNYSAWRDDAEGGLEWLFPR